MASVPYMTPQSLHFDMPYTKLGTKRRPNGDFVGSYDSGKTAMVGSYVYGQPSGKWQRWYENGNTESIHHYLSGALHGWYRQYFENGDKAREGSFFEGKPDGVHRIYFPGKELRQQFEYKKGKLIHVGLTLRGVRRFILNPAGDFDSPLTAAHSFTKLCSLQNNGSLICKTHEQIFADLSTMLSPELIGELMEYLDSLYDEAGLDRGKPTLVGCGDSVLALEADASGGPTVALTDNPSLERAPMTQTEVEKIAEACRSATWNGMGLDDSAPGFESARSGLINDTVAEMNEAVANCREGGTSGEFVGVAFLIPLAVTVIGGLIVGGAVVAIGNAVDDGYGDPVEPGANPEVSYYNNSSDVKREVYDDGREVVTRPTNTTEPGKKAVVQGRPNEHGIVSTAYYDGPTYATATTLVLETISRLATGEVLATRTPPPPGQESTGWISTPQPPPPPAGSPGVDQPGEEGGGSRCEDVARWWEDKKDHCEKNKWETYDCDQIIRVLNGCVDSALINPNPEGDATCPHRKDTTWEEQRAWHCRQRSGIMLPSGHGGDQCQIRENISRPALDICSDPAAMCRPDMLVAEDLYGSYEAGSARPALLEGRAEAHMIVRAQAHEGIRHLGDDDFEHHLGELAHPALVVFGARSCQPCKRVIRDLDMMQTELPEKLPMFYIEVPQNPRLAAAYDVKFTPTLVLFDRDKILGQRKVGAASRDMLLRWVNRSLGLEKTRPRSVA